MSIKTALIALIALFSCAAANAQDKIYTREGDVIQAKIKEVTTKVITYKKQDNPDGPEYSINKNNVEKITYQNGTEDKFDEAEEAPVRRRMPPSPFQHNAGKGDMRYGKNIVSFSPLQLSSDYVTSGIGIGLSYERVLDKNGIISFYIPVSISFNNNNNNYSNGYNPNNTTYNTFYAFPGIKFYPTGSRGPIRYSLGTSFVFAQGTYGAGYYNSTTGTQTFENSTYSIFGFMINNTLNANPTPHIYLGLELGLGASYTNSLNNNYNNNYSTNATNPIVQFSFRIGYRF
ncbi:MAG: hypothetical protein H0X33_10260 [Taibaiella sp.]|nr:hypothetical protein [Taibaiella sp.]